MPLDVERLTIDIEPHLAARRFGLDVGAAMDAHRGMCEVGPAIERGQIGNNPRLRQLADDHDVESPIVGPRVGRDVHATAKEAAVGRSREYQRARMDHISVHAHRDFGRAVAQTATTTA